MPAQRRVSDEKDATALPCHGAQVVVTCGGVAEWSNAAVSKTVIGASLSEVRILSPPPVFKFSPEFDISRLAVKAVKYKNFSNFA